MAGRDQSSGLGVDAAPRASRRRAAQPLKEEVEVVRRFDARVDRLWERLCSRFALAVRRDARYLNWKYAEPPHVRYTMALLRRGEEVEGYVVYRHLREPQGRVTQIVDLLADPADERGIKTLARWVDREARMDDSDKIRCYVSNAAFRRVLRRSGYFVVKSGIDLTVKVNAVPVPKGFYESADEWHFTARRRRTGSLDNVDSNNRSPSADIVTAMKAKDPTRLTALRMLKTALTNKSIEKGRALEGRRGTAGRVDAGQAAARLDRAVHQGRPPGSRRQGTGGDRRS